MDKERKDSQLKQPVSIVIPTANLGERSLEYLECCLISIQMQDYFDIDVIISDHSQDDKIEKYITEDCTVLFPTMSYVRYKANYGSAAANLNNALDQITGVGFVKPLFQDDILRTPDAIRKMVECLEKTGVHWLGVGCNHIDDNEVDMNYNHPPRWIQGLNMAHGLNLIGSPSVVMFRNCDLRMDINLRYLNDCEFYYRMGLKYGAPALLNELLVTIRMREAGLSSTLDVDTVKFQESQYIQKKYANG